MRSWRSALAGWWSEGCTEAACTVGSVPWCGRWPCSAWRRCCGSRSGCIVASCCPPASSRGPGPGRRSSRDGRRRPRCSRIRSGSSFRGSISPDPSCGKAGCRSGTRTRTVVSRSWGTPRWHWAHRWCGRCWSSVWPGGGTSPYWPACWSLWPGRFCPLRGREPRPYPRTDSPGVDRRGRVPEGRPARGGRSLVPGMDGVPRRTGGALGPRTRGSHALYRARRETRGPVAIPADVVPAWALGRRPRPVDPARKGGSSGIPRASLPERGGGQGREDPDDQVAGSQQRPVPSTAAAAFTRCVAVCSCPGLTSRK